jgi:uncharacterized membrane protein
MGNAGKGVVAISSIAAIALMVVGYKSATFTPLWQLGDWAVHLNNLLMLLAVALFGLGSSKSRLRGKLRHPMLAGFLVWVGAHLLVNGDLPSLILFGGMGLWAVISIQLINRAEPAPEPYSAGSAMGDIRLAVITLVVFAFIVAIHMWVGPAPFATGAP